MALIVKMITNICPRKWNYALPWRWRW